MTEAVRRNIFVSYAHEDASWLDRFLKALQPAVGHNVEIWCDRDMLEGTDWQSTIEAKLASASSALVLVTDAFLSSSFVTGVELPAILKRHRAGLLNLHWVLISHVLSAALESCTLSGLQAAWPIDPPINDLSEVDRDRAIHQVCEKLIAESGRLSQVSDDDRLQLGRDLERALVRHNQLELGDPIGSGDSSIVYAGKLDGRKVAVKVLIESVLQSQLNGLAAYANKVRDVDDPTFASLLCLDLSARPQFMVLEYVDEPCLGRYLHAQGKPFAPDEVVHLIRQLALALEQYHDRGVCYGPFTANDLFFDRERMRLRLPAVGISSFLTASGVLGHSFPRDMIAATYLIPEQFNGLPYQTASDVYALGLIAFEMLQGRPPVEVRCLADLVGKRAFFAAPQNFNNGWVRLQPMLATLVSSMLAAESPARPTMREVADRLLHIESEHVAVAKAIYQRHFRNNRVLYAKFYARFFARCPEARTMFANIDEQYAKLDAALQALLDFPSGPRLEPTALTHLAEVHRMHRVGAEQLEHFANSLLDTLKEECGEQDHAVEAWNLTFRVGLAYLKQQLARLSQPQVLSANESVAS